MGVATTGNPMAIFNVSRFSDLTCQSGRPAPAPGVVSDVSIGIKPMSASRSHTTFQDVGPLGAEVGDACSESKEIGFLSNERRFNVAWTRARYGRIVIGDRATLEGTEIWTKEEHEALPSDGEATPDGDDMMQGTIWTEKALQHLQNSSHG